MLLPAERNLEGIIGASWDQEILLWADAAETIPFAWAGGWAVARVEVDGVGQLTPGAGLTATDGSVVCYFPSSATAALADGERTPWRLVLSDPNGDDQFPMHGLVFWEKP